MRLKWDRKSAPRGTRPIGALLTGIVTGTQDRFRTVSGHAKTFLRFLRTERGKFAVPAAGIGIALWGGIFLCQSILGKMLREDAQATSSAWVSMLVARNPEIFDLLAGDAASDETRHLLDESSQVGDIYRFRIWNTAGHLVYKSERMTSAGARMNGKQVVEALLSRTIINEVHEGSQTRDARFFVESFIPVKQDGEVVGVFDVYLDQSDDEILYKRSIFLTEIIVGVLVLLAAGIPGYAVYRNKVKLSEAAAEAVFVSEHDSLTGIPNRNWLNNVAAGALALNRGSKKQIAVLIIDMDRFRDLNDSYGHATGDKVLKAAAKRLRSSILEVDAVARFGGDEFAVVQIGMYQPNGASALANRLIDVLSEPYEIDGSELTCGASVGIAISPPDAEDFDALIVCADTALHKAKAAGRGCARFFEAGMDAKIRERRQIEMDIRRALATDSFQLAYQPVHSFHDGRLLGFEALLRWPEGWSPKSPAEFIPIAEECGLINRIGTWALETACKTAANWTNPLKVAVNLSPLQFRDGKIAYVVKHALRISGLDPQRLELEVTESLWIQDTDSVLVQLERLRKMGVSISLDDFGTGYSSLSYLWKFPFDTVKIDQSFVREMETDPKAAAIVSTITGLGKTLGLAITAEGVEKPSQAKILREAGCDRAQGFLFGRPLSAASANALAGTAPIPAQEELDVRSWLVAS
jgi:diguanylate cyclase (GGDEF)-like protein